MKQIKVVTIVAEKVLAEALTADLEELGANGFTMVDGTGKGSRGRRVGEIPGENVRIETLVGAATAARILERLEAKYFPSYAVVAWVTDAGVARGEKFQ